LATFVYNPGVQVHIQTATKGIVDISSDVSAGTLTLNENNLHSLTLTILNQNRKYDRAFIPNDGIVVYMKRVTWLLTFTGYLNVVPYYTIWPRSVQINASCTIKRIQNHWWDPGTYASTALLAGVAGVGNESNDGGIKQKMLAVLTKVGGWDPSKIHIGNLPSDWLSKVSNLFTLEQSEFANTWTTLGGSATINGSSPLQSGITANVRNDAPTGGQLPTNFGQATIDTTLPNFTCKMQWGYQLSNGVAAPGVNATAVQAWLANRKIMICNSTNNNAVIVSPDGWGPPTNSKNEVIALDSASSATLNLDPGVDVSIFFITQVAEAATPIGQWEPAAGTAAATAAANSNPTGNAVPGTLGIAYPIPAGASTAVTYALAQVGKSYVWGGGRPENGGSHSSFDCSGLVGNAWAAAGILIGGDPSGTTYVQYANTQSIDVSQAQPGDLIFYFMDSTGPSHVAMYIGNGRLVQGTDPAHGIQNLPVYQNGIVGYFRVFDPATNPSKSTSVTPMNAAVAAAEGAAGAETAAAGGGTTSTSTTTGTTSTSTTSTGTPLVNFWDWFGQAPDPLSQVLSGPRALMNDTPLLPTVSMLAQASMRSWCAAPNGDFIAWFPDYFGVFKTAAIMNIELVELQDFTVVWSDTNMVTHQFVSGASITNPFSSIISNTTAFSDYINAGFASIDFPAIMETLFNVGPGDTSGFGSAPAMYSRFGARPNWQQMQNIYGTESEFWFALYLFQQNWANMFTATVPITFMPELFPGMLIQIGGGIDFQAYVSQVTHTWSMAEGAGFQTSLVISCPASTSGSQLYGLADFQGGI